MKTNKFFLDIFRLTASTVIVQIFSFLTIPILSRFYSPETFGEFALFLSILGPLGVIVGFGLEPAIMIANTDDEAKLVFQLSNLMTFLYSLILFIILLISDLYFNFNISFQIIILIPIIVLLGGLSNSLRYWNLRKNNFNIVSSSTIFSAMTDRVSTLVLAFVGYTQSTSLVFGVIIDAVVRPFTLLFGIRKTPILLYTKKYKISQYYVILKKFKKFPLYVLPTNFFMRISGDIPVYLLTIFFTTSIVGFYSIGLRLLNMPLSLIAKSIGEVYFQRASASDEINKNQIIETVFRKLVEISFLPFCYILISGQDLLVSILGIKWIDAGVYVQIFSIFYFIRFVFSLNDYILVIKNKQEYNLVLNICLAILTVFSIVIGAYFKNIILAIILITLLNSLMYWFFSIRLYKECNLDKSKIYLIFIKEFKKSIIYVLFFLFIKYFIEVNMITQYIYIIISVFMSNKMLIYSIIKKNKHVK